MPQLRPEEHLARVLAGSLVDDATLVKISHALASAMDRRGEETTERLRGLIDASLRDLILRALAHRKKLRTNAWREEVVL